MSPSLAPTAANALKHGLTGPANTLPPDLSAKAAELEISFTARFQPTDDYERLLVAEAAVAAVRLKRCQQLEFAQTTHYQIRDLDADSLQRVIDAKKLIRTLPRDPELIRDRLLTTVPGCQQLLNARARLEIRLKNPTLPWTARHTKALLDLLGIHPSDRDADRKACQINTLTAQLDNPTSRPAAAQALLDLLRQDLELIAHRFARAEELQTSRRNLIAAGQWSEPPQEIKNLRRYELQNRRILAAAVAQLEARNPSPARSSLPDSTCPDLAEMGPGEPASAPPPSNPSAAPTTRLESTPVTCPEPDRACPGSTVGSRRPAPPLPAQLPIPKAAQATARKPSPSARRQLLASTASGLIRSDALQTRP